MTSDGDHFQVIVEDIGVDAALLRRGEHTAVLVLRPTQTFTNATRALSACAPWLHPDAVRRIVRTYLPASTEIRDITPNPTVTRPAPTGGVFTRRAPAVLAAASLCVASVALGYLLHRPGHRITAPLPLWAGPVFGGLLTHGVRCRPAGTSEDGIMDGSCSNLRTGGAVPVRVLVGNGYVIWRFIDGRRRVVLRCDKTISAAHTAVAFARRTVRTPVVTGGTCLMFGDRPVIPALWQVVGSLPADQPR